MAYLPVYGSQKVLGIRRVRDMVHALRGDVQPVNAVPQLWSN